MATTVDILEARDPRLKRHRVHDSRSRSFQIARSATKRPQDQPAVKYERKVPIWDQGEVGCCTADAMLGMLCTGTFYRKSHVFTQADCYALYRAETRLDEREIPGIWEPDDTGSAFLYAAKAAAKFGYIRSYQTAFGLTAACAALQVKPLNFGTVWYEAMMEPTKDGELKPRGEDYGGHEYIIDEWDPKRQRLWMTNHWTKDWGINGRAWMSLSTADLLLRRQGDVGTVSI